MVLGFFTASRYTPKFDFKADFVSVRGEPVAEKIREFREAGYKRVIYGTSTGHDNYYVVGRWDGKRHYDEIQLSKYPDIVWEGTALAWYKVPIGHYVAITFPPTRLGSYYVVPTANFIKFKQEEVKGALEAGADGVEFDQPEFWTRAGYSEAFKREWEKFRD